jgi:hypothetical protein
MTLSVKLQNSVVQCKEEASFITSPRRTSYTSSPGHVECCLRSWHNAQGDIATIALSLQDPIYHHCTCIPQFKDTRKRGFLAISPIEQSKKKTETEKTAKGTPSMHLHIWLTSAHHSTAQQAATVCSYVWLCHLEGTILSACGACP